MTPKDMNAELLVASRAELLDEQSEIGQAMRADAGLRTAAEVCVFAETALRDALSSQRPGLETRAVIDRYRRRPWMFALSLSWWLVAVPLLLILAGLMVYAALTIATIPFVR
ncbi:MAG: hypothetical protein H7Z74_13005 [Anaerolineae bacterium]|nr:hypothetical protein [Gemmatimonadaceae bacterium]